MIARDDWRMASEPLDRRTFLTAAATAAAGATMSARAQDPAPAGPQRRAFRLAYAPHFGMFANHAPDLLDQIQFAADEGFTAWEDNGMAGRDAAQQEKISKKLQQCSMTMGVFVAHVDWDNPTFTSGRQDLADKVLADVEAATVVGKRVGARWATLVPGLIDPQLDHGFQMANAIELLRRCAAIAAKAELTLVLEALNKRDHPRLFLTGIAQGYEICRAVNMPSCKILDDLYHQQISEGNLIPNLDRAWSEIAYFQIGDNPGRCEPGTGEINYRNIFRHLHGKGYRGVLGMEHGKHGDGKDGERALIAAYRDADSF